MAGLSKSPTKYTYRIVNVEWPMCLISRYELQNLLRKEKTCLASNCIKYEMISELTTADCFPLDRMAMSDRALTIKGIEKVLIQ